MRRFLGDLCRDGGVASGDLVVNGLGGSLRVQVASGDARISDVKDLLAEAASGDVRINNVTGSLRVSLVSGDLQVTAGARVDSQWRSRPCRET